MRLVSVSPVAEVSRSAENLIHNGDFREFMAGAPCPTRFVPPKAGSSRVSRVRDDDGSSGALQEWLIPDHGAALADHFRVHLIGIKADTEYTLEVDASSVEGVGASVSLFEMESDGKTPAPLELDFIRVKPEAGHREVYKKQFRTQKGVRLAIAMHASEETPAGGKVVWHELVLNESRP